MNLKSFGAPVALFFALALTAQAEAFRIAAYNVENYLDKTTETRRDVKSAASKAKIRESITATPPTCR